MNHQRVAAIIRLALMNLHGNLESICEDHLQWDEGDHDDADGYLEVGGVRFDEELDKTEVSEILGLFGMERDTNDPMNQFNWKPMRDVTVMTRHYPLGYSDKQLTYPLPAEQDTEKPVVICEGEIDAAMLAQQNPNAHYIVPGPLPIITDADLANEPSAFKVQRYGEEDASIIAIVSGPGRGKYRIIDEFDLPEFYRTALTPEELQKFKDIDEDEEFFDQHSEAYYAAWTIDLNTNPAATLRKHFPEVSYPLSEEDAALRNELSARYWKTVDLEDKWGANTAINALLFTIPLDQLESLVEGREEGMASEQEDMDEDESHP